MSDNNRPFEASVICYRHHPNTGETINIGILLVVPEMEYIGIAFEQRYHHLSTLYKTFNPEEYATLLNGVAKAVAERGKVAISLQEMQQELVPGQNSRISFSQPVTGTTDNPDAACNFLFVQLVGGPRPWHEAAAPQAKAQPQPVAEQEANPSTED